MLGLIRRAALRRGPAQLQKLFRRTSSARRQIEPCSLHGHARILKRTAFGLTPVYNALPDDVRGANTVTAFQRALQNMVRQNLLDGRADWRVLLSPRHCCDTPSWHPAFDPARPLCEPECNELELGQHHPCCSV